MDVNTFYTYDLKQRMEIVALFGEFISRIKCYGFMINLYLVEKFLVEVYYNRYSDMIELVEIVDPKDENLYLYVDKVDLSDLLSK